MDWEQIKGYITSAGTDLLRGIAVFIVGCLITRWILKLWDREDFLRKVDPTAKAFLKNLARVLLYVLVVFTTANTLGLPMTSIITLFASAGVAVSLALQGVLGNLLGGFILMILKPIKVGEYVKLGENEGTVKTITTFYTQINTVDNRMISLPNGSLTNMPIVNYSREPRRRADFTFSVSYDSNMDQVYDVLKKTADTQEGALMDPAPVVHLSECADSSLDFIVWIWVEPADYVKVKYAFQDRGKRALDAAGISIPYPQMDVHMK